MIKKIRIVNYINLKIRIFASIFIKFDFIVIILKQYHNR